jgi:hypothetical protein
MFALDYDNDRHFFFLSHIFRNKYDTALKNYPSLQTVEFKLLEIGGLPHKQNPIEYYFQ